MFTSLHAKCILTSCIRRQHVSSLWSSYFNIVTKFSMIRVNPLSNLPPSTHGLFDRSDASQSVPYISSPDNVHTSDYLTYSQAGRDATGLRPEVTHDAQFPQQTMSDTNSNFMRDMSISVSASCTSGEQSSSEVSGPLDVTLTSSVVSVDSHTSSLPMISVGGGTSSLTATMSSTSSMELSTDDSQLGISPSHDTPCMIRVNPLSKLSRSPEELFNVTANTVEMIQGDNQTETTCEEFPLECESHPDTQGALLQGAGDTVLDGRAASHASMDQSPSDRVSRSVSKKHLSTAHRHTRLPPSLLEMVTRVVREKELSSEPIQVNDCDKAGQESSAFFHEFASRSGIPRLHVRCLDSTNRPVESGGSKGVKTLRSHEEGQHEDHAMVENTACLEEFPSDSGIPSVCPKHVDSTDLSCENENNSSIKNQVADKGQDRAQGADAQTRKKRKRKRSNSRQRKRLHRVSISTVNGSTREDAVCHDETSDTDHVSASMTSPAEKPCELSGDADVTDRLLKTRDDCSPTDDNARESGDLLAIDISSVEDDTGSDTFGIDSLFSAEKSELGTGGIDTYPSYRYMGSDHYEHSSCTRKRIIDKFDRAFILHERSERKKSKKRKCSSEASEDTGKKKPKPKTERPNYFIALQITEPMIHHHVAAIQEHVLEQQPDLSKSFIQLTKLHLTLYVMYLEDEEQLTTTKLAMDRVGERMKRKCADLFRIEGLRNFRDNVVFGCVADTTALQQMQALASEVEKELKSADIEDRGKGFQPHMTIMKLSKARNLHKKGIRKIDPKLYADFKDQVFGSQLVGDLQLCAMASDRKTGYYVIEHAVSLGNEQLVFPVIMEKTLEWTFQSGDTLTSGGSDPNKPLTGNKTVGSTGSVTSSAGLDYVKCAARTGSDDETGSSGSRS